MGVARQQGQDVRQILVAYEADHAVEFPVGRGFQLVGDVGDAVGVVARVADRERRFSQRLPASHQGRVGRGAAHAFEARREMVSGVSSCRKSTAAEAVTMLRLW